jgi:hypothetical protein
MPAPSLPTKPSRWQSQGRLARSGFRYVWTTRMASAKTFTAAKATILATDI